jgi:twitching motility protein PilT
MKQDEATCPEPLRQWLTLAVDREASDLHLVVGHPPVLRVHGVLYPLDEPELEAQRLEALLLPACPSPYAERFKHEKNTDFSLSVTLDTQPQRFRANYFFNGQHIGACFRVIPSQIPDFKWASFPEELAERLTSLRNGLILVSGVTGSGKTTTLAMLINKLNLAGGYRIITIEEPIEYLFPRVPRSVVTQREVGVDVSTFADGLKYGLRQDPDVMLVGEIRDRETAQIALSAAETGHLVLSTLHTRDAKGAISRIVDLFPQMVQHEIRSQLAMGLRSVISQHLLPSAQAGTMRHLALEVMFNNSPIASAIRFSKLESIDNCILTGRAAGMITLDESVRRLLLANKIDRQTAEHFVSDITVLDRRRRATDG